MEQTPTLASEGVRRLSIYPTIMHNGTDDSLSPTEDFAASTFDPKASTSQYPELHVRFDAVINRRKNQAKSLKVSLLRDFHSPFYVCEVVVIIC